jgi:hypothetical protein
VSAWRRDYPEVAEIADEQGWNDETLLHLALDYIDGQEEVNDLVEHLQVVQREENEMSDDQLAED